MLADGGMRVGLGPMSAKEIVGFFRYSFYGLKTHILFPKISNYFNDLFLQPLPSQILEYFPSSLWFKYYVHLFKRTKANPVPVFGHKTLWW
jgi:hypothetical protein